MCTTVDDIFTIGMNVKMMLSTPQLSEDNVHIKVVTFGLKLESYIGFLQGED